MEDLRLKIEGEFQRALEDLAEFYDIKNDDGSLDLRGVLSRGLGLLRSIKEQKEKGYDPVYINEQGKVVEMVIYK